MVRDIERFEAGFKPEALTNQERAHQRGLEAEHARPTQSVAPHIAIRADRILHERRRVKELNAHCLQRTTRTRRINIRHHLIRTVVSQTR
jgi:hypothetical protein